MKDLYLDRTINMNIDITQTYESHAGEHNNEPGVQVFKEWRVVTLVLVNDYAKVW